MVKINHNLTMNQPIFNKLSSQIDTVKRDILGILKVQGELLDFNYLNDWSNRLGCTQELQQAQTEAGL